MNGITYTKKDIGLKFKIGKIIYYKVGSIKLNRKCKILEYWINDNKKGYYVKVLGLSIKIHLFPDEIYIKNNTIKKL